ncbi:hypothetical protein HOA59_00005 [archaeon]|jgi:hypothetical protein|nr:hypothetical protein [archaeon]MBT6823807.1 hypothetical protein [archaeon]MBT7107158.1 hypothetical protein [archaeon]MBT7297268.1 hypothetical protein [archaeon]
MEIIHFTSEENWKSIQNSGFLLPKTRPNNFNQDNLGDLKDIVRFDEYIVGIPTEKYKGWKESYVTHRLWQYTSYEAILKFPIIWESGSFVRDHYLFSPRRFKDDLKINIMDYYNQVYIGKENVDKDLQDMVNSYEKKFIEEYILSSVLLEDYDESYKAPEVWSPQVTPIDIIGQISFRELRNKNL